MNKKLKIILLGLGITAGVLFAGTGFSVALVYTSLGKSGSEVKNLLSRSEAEQLVSDAQEFKVALTSEKQLLKDNKKISTLDVKKEDIEIIYDLEKDTRLNYKVTEVKPSEDFRKLIVTIQVEINNATEDYQVKKYNIEIDGFATRQEIENSSIQKQALALIQEKFVSLKNSGYLTFDNLAKIRSKDPNSKLKNPRYVLPSQILNQSYNQSDQNGQEKTIKVYEPQIINHDSNPILASSNLDFKFEGFSDVSDEKGSIKANFLATSKEGSNVAFNEKFSFEFQTINNKDFLVYKQLVSQALDRLKAANFQPLVKNTVNKSTILPSQVLSNNISEPPSDSIEDLDLDPISSLSELDKKRFVGKHINYRIGYVGKQIYERIFNNTKPEPLGFNSYKFKDINDLDSQIWQDFVDNEKNLKDLKVITSTAENAEIANDSELFYKEKTTSKVLVQIIAEAGEGSSKYTESFFRYVDGFLTQEELESQITNAKPRFEVLPSRKDELSSKLPSSFLPEGASSASEIDKSEIVSLFTNPKEINRFALIRRYPWLNFEIESINSYDDAKGTMSARVNVFLTKEDHENWKKLDQNDSSRSKFVFLNYIVNLEGFNTSENVNSERIRKIQDWITNQGRFSFTFTGDRASQRFEEYLVNQIKSENVVLPTLDEQFKDFNPELSLQRVIDPNQSDIEHGILTLELGLTIDDSSSSTGKTPLYLFTHRLRGFRSKAFDIANVFNVIRTFLRVPRNIFFQRANTLQNTILPNNTNVSDFAIRDLPIKIPDPQKVDDKDRLSAQIVQILSRNPQNGSVNLQVKVTYVVDGVTREELVNVIVPGFKTIIQDQVNSAQVYFRNSYNRYKPSFFRTKEGAAKFVELVERVYIGGKEIPSSLISWNLEYENITETQANDTDGILTFSYTFEYQNTTSRKFENIVVRNLLTTAQERINNTKVTFTKGLNEKETRKPEDVDFTKIKEWITSLQIGSEKLEGSSGEYEIKIIESSITRNSNRGEVNFSYQIIHKGLTSSIFNDGQIVGLLSNDQLAVNEFQIPSVQLNQKGREKTAQTFDVTDIQINASREVSQRYNFVWIFETSPLSNDQRKINRNFSVEGSNEPGVQIYVQVSLKSNPNALKYVPVVISGFKTEEQRNNEIITSAISKIDALNKGSWWDPSKEVPKGSEFGALSNEQKLALMKFDRITSVSYELVSANQVGSSNQEWDIVLKLKIANIERQVSFRLVNFA
ncbi:lipoprotein 17-related variable surface protein [Mycoplasmopsis pulmonis]|uniref:lipoprotein 17-related variable surface protein n=1 Tax=Mycoplasmopsis pulmonis TaxID=2107 RepID=UPI001004FC47|nr:lipoprotein 17-related variable surface protein [Mycoplasmopsis pulmonis]VEU68324.1 Uncharacterised protein [Mycoplasmopsis pulmonis]